MWQEDVSTRSDGLGTGQVSLPDVHFTFWFRMESSISLKPPPTTLDEKLRQDVWAHDPYQGRCQQLSICQDLKVLLLSNDREYDNGAFEYYQRFAWNHEILPRICSKNKDKLAEVVACSGTPLLLTSKTEDWSDSYGNTLLATIQIVTCRHRLFVHQPSTLSLRSMSSAIWHSKQCIS